MAIVPSKENKNIEFKERLSSTTHLKEEKKQHLAAQMKYLLDLGKGNPGTATTATQLRLRMWQ